MSEHECETSQAPQEFSRKISNGVSSWQNMRQPTFWIKRKCGTLKWGSSSSADLTSYKAMKVAWEWNNFFCEEREGVTVTKMQVATHYKSCEPIIVGLHCGFELGETTSVEFKSVPKDFWAFKSDFAEFNAIAILDYLSEFFIVWNLSGQEPSGSGRFLVLQFFFSSSSSFFRD